MTPTPGNQPKQVASRIAFTAISLLLTLSPARVLHAEEVPGLESGLTAGPPFDELARMDNAIFDATFVL